MHFSNGASRWIGPRGGYVEDDVPFASLEVVSVLFTSVPMLRYITSKMSQEEDLVGHYFANERWMGADPDVLEQGKAEYEEFARRTWSGLMELSRLQSGSPGLSLFGRLDVGVMNPRPHVFEFYVNEVERSATCNLFVDNFSHDANVIPLRIAKEIPRYCSKRRV